jgi:hypothetical protein
MWVTLEAFNPSIPALAVALLGVKSHLLYIPLLVLAPTALVQTKMRFERQILLYIVFVALPISALGIYQYFSPAGSWINRYIRTDDVSLIATAGLEGRVRITGSFSYISGMVAFAVFNISLAGGLILSGLKRGGFVLWAGTALLFLTLVVAPMTGSRGVIYLPTIAFVLLAIQAVRQGRVNVRVIGFLLVAGTLASLALGTWLFAGWTSLSQRASGSTDARARIEDVILGPVSRAQEAGLTGFGVGTTHQAAPYLVPGRLPYEWLPSPNFEEENGRVALETGIIGLVLYLLVKLRLCIIAFQALNRSRSSWEICWTATAFLFMLDYVISGTIFNGVAGAMFWPLAGIALAIWSRQAEGSGATLTQVSQPPSIPAAR